MIFKLPTEITIQNLLKQEDTDGDKKITVDDCGIKSFLITNVDGVEIAIEGTFCLSNLLQELALAKKQNLAFATIDLAHIQENAVDRISRKIKDLYWHGLTRTIDEAGLAQILSDEKTTSDYSYLYVPFGENEAFNYYQNLEKSIANLKVVQLPQSISEEFLETLNKKPGLLSLALQFEDKQISGVPFVVPGGRFNEMYGWDSYFIAVGLLVDGKYDLALAIAENFKFQIDHYGKILNANRSYYLSRTQPPFYSSLVIDIIKHANPNKSWIKKHLQSIIKEYQNVWMQNGKRLTENGLNRYKAEGVGLPFEVEPGHFDDELEKFAPKYKLTTAEFEKQYLERKIVDAELDNYFVHDRSMRESGHDTTNRLVNVCADLNPISLNSLLYKYERDIAHLIETVFDNTFHNSENVAYTSEYWNRKAADRRILINDLCWNEEHKMYFDYNFIKKEAHIFEAATTFYPLWAKLCSADQAKYLVEEILPKFLMKGGIAGSSKNSVENLPDNAPVRQWDYPFGWAPHQMLLWEGLLNYGYEEKAQEMVYRWLWLITKNAVDYNGTIPEKFDLETSSHKVFAEYGNVGTDFAYITEEGFGWMNASYQYGLTILNADLRIKLADCVDPELIFS